MPDRRVVVGCAAVTCLGGDLGATWEGLVAGRSGLRRHSLLEPARYLQSTAGLVEGFGEPLPRGQRDEGSVPVKLAARSIHFALTAARAAWSDAGLDRVEIDPHGAAVVIGSAFGGHDQLEAEQARAARRRSLEVSPYLVPNLIINQAAGQVAQQLGLRGPSIAPANACATGGHAIALGGMFLRAGEAEIALCGGTESAFTPAIVNGFRTMKAMIGDRVGDRSADDPAQASRPFSIDRAGFVMAEGAGMLVLATESTARRLCLRPQAELAAWAINSDGHHMAIPHREGIARCLATALERAKIGPEQVGYYNAHGTSTRVNDLVETEVLKQVFGSHAYRMPVSSIKGALGHSLGAASAIEAAVCVRALVEQTVPPTINHVADPELDLDYVPHAARQVSIEYAMSASFGFGGTNNALILKKVNHA
jgi:3-oxoacyl-[acyl-carrier-protein] synthase II